MPYRILYREGRYERDYKLSGGRALDVQSKAFKGFTFLPDKEVVIKGDWDLFPTFAVVAVITTMADIKAAIEAVVSPNDGVEIRLPVFEGKVYLVHESPSGGGNDDNRRSGVAS